MKNMQIDIMNAELIGLTFTGELEEGRPQFIGTDKQWNLFNRQ